MEIITDTAKNIVMYMIFTTVIKNMIADTHYAKYAEFFMGLLLILILIGPLAKIIRLDVTFEDFINIEEFQIGLKDAKNELYAGEGNVNEAVLKNAEKTMGEQIKKMAEKENLNLDTYKIGFAKEEENFGTIKKIELWLSDETEKIHVNKIRLSKEDNQAEKYAFFVSQIEEIYNVDKEIIYVYEN